MAQTIDRVALLRSLRGFTDEDPNPEDDMAPYDPAPVGQTLDPRIPALMQARGVATQGAPKFSTPFEDEQMSSLESGIREASTPQPRRPWASMLQAGLEGLAFGKNAPAITAQRDADSRQALQDKIKRLQDIRQGVSQREMADISLQNTEATRDYQKQQMDITRGREERLAKASDATNQANLRKQGLRLKKDPMTGEATGEFEPVPRTEMSPEEVADLDTKQAAVELKKAQKEVADATAELRKFQADPNSPQFALAHQKLAVAQQNADTAKQRLGISEESLGLREATFNQANFGQFEKVKPILSSIRELADKVNTSDGVYATAKGTAREQAAQVNLDDDVAEYQAVISGFTPLLARAVGHTGVLTEQDVQSVRSMLPQPKDSQSVKDRKLARIETIMSGVKKGAETATGRTAPGGAASVKPIVQHNKATGEYRHSLDGGKTWLNGKP